MIKIEIYDYTKSSYCSNIEDAKKIYDKIDNCMKMKGLILDIVLDFTRIQNIYSEFFYYMIGQLLKDYTEEEVKSIISVENINKPIHDSYLFTIKHYNKYFRDTKYREDIDKTFSKSKQTV